MDCSRSGCGDARLTELRGSPNRLPRRREAFTARILAIALLLGCSITERSQAQLSKVYGLPFGASEPNLPAGVLFVCSSKHPPSAGACGKAPHLKHSEDPEYTEAARKAGIEGRSEFWTIIGTDGRPHEVYIVKPLGYGLDQQAIKAIRRWRFAPTTQDGKPVPIAIRLQINFRLR